MAGSFFHGLKDAVLDTSRAEGGQKRLPEVRVTKDPALGGNGHQSGMDIVPDGRDPLAREVPFGMIPLKTLRLGNKVELAVRPDAGPWGIAEDGALSGENFEGRSAPVGSEEGGPRSLA